MRKLIYVACLLAGTAAAQSAGLPRESVARAAGDGKIYVNDVKFATDEIAKSCAGFIKLKKIDWPGVSSTFLKEAAAVRDDAHHLVLLTRLLARLRDGHAEVRPLEKGKGVAWPADAGGGERTGPGLFFCKIGGKLYIKNAWSSAAAAGVEPGMEVLRIQQMDPLAWMGARGAKLADLVSFSTDQQQFFYTCHWGLADLPGTTLELELKNAAGNTIKKKVQYTKANPVPNGPAWPPANLKSTKDIHYGTTADGFGYIHFRRSPADLPAQLDEALAAIGSVPGMILDFRGNSGGGTDHEALMGRFVPAGTTLKFTNKYSSAGANPFGGPVVVIVDATVRSTGETLAGIFKEDGRAWMIGESPTAGMSSSKTTINLPSGLFSLYISVASNKARFNGGRGIEGIGVIPHEIVEFTPADLAAKTDTLIRRAGELLKNFPHKSVPYKSTAAPVSK